MLSKDGQHRTHPMHHAPQLWPMTTILHVISGLGLGGAERALTELAIGLRKRGYVQHVLSLRGRGHHAEQLEAAGIPVDDANVGSIAQAGAAVRAGRKLVGRLAPDIIQGWMYHGNLAAAAMHLFTGGRKRRRLIWNIRASNMDARYAKIIFAGRLLSRLPDTIVTNSKAGAEFHASRGFPAQRMIVIPNGINTQKYRPDPIARAQVRAELGLNDRVIAIHVARVDPMKDQAAFLEAMAELPGIVGLMIGAGTETLGCPRNVRALGARSDTARYYAAADLVVSSSAFGEGFSNAIAEGMSAGLVPVATDVGDAAHIIGGTGQIVAPESPPELAAAIKQEAAMPLEQRRKRGLEARARIESLFAQARAIEAYAQLYENRRRTD